MTFLLVDGLLLWILVRSIEAARKSDIPSEIFKIIGVVVGCVIALHYYARLGAFLHANVFAPDEVKNMVAFGFIAGVVMFIFSLVRDGWIAVLDLHIKPEVNAIGSVILGTIKTYFIFGFIVIGLVTSGNELISNSARKSIFGYLPKQTLISFYDGFYSGVVNTIFANEPKNKNVQTLTLATMKEAMGQQSDHP